MAAKQVVNLLKKQDFEYEIRDCERDFDSTEDAMELLGVPMERIAKTLVFAAPIGVNVIVLSGDARIDFAKYEKKFKVKKVVLDAEDLLDYTGYVSGAVSPLALANKRAKVYLDVSLKRFEDSYVYPSAGTLNSAIGITSLDLYKVSGAKEWIDICEGWQ